MRATCKIGDRVRLNIPVVETNTHTVWVEIHSNKGQPYSKPRPVWVKRHLRKHGISLMQGGRS